MSLNTYGDIKSYTDGEKDITFKVSVENLSDKQIVELKHLRDENVVQFVIQSATLIFKDEANIETNESKYHYYANREGIWVKEEIEQTQLEIDGQPNYDVVDRKVTANVVDDFIIREKIVYEEDFDVKRALYLMSEGYEYDAIADMLKMTTVEMMSALNEARQYFAPFAAAWKKLKDEAEK